MILNHAVRNDDKPLIADTYDSEGRVTKETRPWGDGGKQRTRNVYAANSSRFYDNRPIKVYTDYETASGLKVNTRVVNYNYEDSADVERITATTYAAGVNHQQVTIDETYGEAAAYTYAAGKPKFRQAVNGVQTWHEYEATTLHNAIHKHSVVIKANGELVAAQSRKAEEFIATNDTITFEQEFIWDGDNWLLLNTTAYEYDEEKRITKTTRGNGRRTTTEWMCCGKLRETNEDGITTSYGYNSAQQLVETIRFEVKDGELVVTPETITSYTYDAAGRQLSVRRDIGAMTTNESTKYDLLGRVIKQTDVLGRETTTKYSEDGLITTITTPAGATFITTRNPDGSTASVAGTGQREIHYTYNLDGKNRAVTETLADGTFLSKTVTDGFDQTVVETTPSMTGSIYNRKQYNAKGQLIKEQKDNGYNATKMAATLLEYDSFGNVTRQTLALADMPTKDNSPVVEISYAVEIMEDGVYNVTTQTRYNTEGNPLVSTQKQLASQLSPTLESKVISVSERGLTSMQWCVYNTNTYRITYNSVPTSTIVAETVTVDGGTVMQKDTTGITTTATRQYTASGIIQTRTDGRGNATTTVTDLAGRTTSVTDAAGNTTTTAYDAHHDAPATITDALGNTTCYRYDVRGRKVAEWGTAIQPACFDYDVADNLISLKTFRAGTEDISTNPSERTDGDETTWNFDAATGLELRKTYADNSSVVKTYDAFNRLATETDARGNVKTHSYEHARGLLLGTIYSDGTTARQYAYNHLGQLTQVRDDAGVRTIGYNSYGEQETDSLLAGGVTHLITETRDTLGRSTGFIYAKNGTVQHTVTTGHASDGRINSAGFVHEGEEKVFRYDYLPGSNLLHRLTHPNGVTLMQTYEAKRNLITEMLYINGNQTAASRRYEYDSMGRPTTRYQQQEERTQRDSFEYNSRSELTAASLGIDQYSYRYDNIGNRIIADGKSYTTNELNQYASVGDFVPQFDADGNQTLLKTGTGVWQVEYNAENRPVRFTRIEGTSTSVVECAYDYKGRRATKKVTINGSVMLYQRFLYRGYLQIACCDLTRSNHPCIWLITWDPTQAHATRPLAIQKDATWYTYGWDSTKNICEVYGQHGYIRTNYTYSPYGEVNVLGDVTQPLQWSSEYSDSEMALVYYNYRHYNPMDGRWIGRDAIGEMGGVNMYCFVKNLPVILNDYQGNSICCEDKCSHEGVTQAQVIIKITSKLGSPDVSDSFATFSEVFNYSLKPLEKAFSPLKIVSKIYGSSLESVSEFFNNQSETPNDTGWVVYGKAQYTVCEYKRCWLFWKNKDLTKKETKWVHSGYILPGQYADAEREVKRKLEKEIKQEEEQ